MPDDYGAGGLDIAVVGMSCRFPGAATLDDYWRVIARGRETVSRFDHDELRRAGADETRLSNPALVNAGGIVPDGENFDAAFFRYSLREAALIDPQQRMFLEAAWHAVEDAGYAPEFFPGKIGVYAGQTLSTHRPVDLDAFLGNTSDLLLSANDKDFLPTRVSYKLGLTGPSVNVQAACSTSLLAIHLACQALVLSECDMALAGGVSWTSLRRQGYLHQQGGTLSADGHTRPFDRDASGFVPADGLGIVVLRRLADAVENGDRIYAVVRGGAVNNDGAARLSYAAPGVAGQTQVIADALAVADVDPNTIGYVEAHGTATAIGDLIEFTALTQAYRSAGATGTGHCGLGSVKANIGHTDAAAGVAGFIKAALLLHHRFLPPSTNFRHPNPQIDFGGSPFHPRTEGAAWARRDHPRRAAVSSFGIGGTNVHLVLEEAPPCSPSGPSRPWQVVALSAPRAQALRTVADRCASTLADQPSGGFADLAYTLATGRHQFRHRLAGVFPDQVSAARALREHAAGGESMHSGDAQAAPPEDLVFLFPGYGAHYPGMCRDLYEREAVFRDSVDECLRLVSDPALAEHVRTALHPALGDDHASGGTGAALDDPVHALVALFVTEVAMGRLLTALGLRATALAGDGVGAYAAACFAGVYSLADALAVVVECGEIRALGVAQGPPEPAALARFRRFLTGVPRRPPTTRLLPANTGGTRCDDVTSPEYWVGQLSTVDRFPDRVDHLLAAKRCALVEVGPGATLSTLVRNHLATTRTDALVVPTAPGPRDRRAATEVLLAAVCQLWTAGVELDLAALYAGERRVRVAAPLFPFDATPCRPAPTPRPASGRDRPAVGVTGQPADWLYGVSWRRSVDIAAPGATRGPDEHDWVVLSDGSPLARDLVAALRRRGADPVVVAAGAEFRGDGSRQVTIVPWQQEHYRRLLSDRCRGARPLRLVDFWSHPDSAAHRPPLASVVGLAHALGGTTRTAEVCVVTSGAFHVTGRERLNPVAACAVAAYQTLALEQPRISVRAVDLDPSECDGQERRLVDGLLDEFAHPRPEGPVGYRWGCRWLRRFEPLTAARLPEPPLRRNGVYVITGGLGGIGWHVADHLAESYQARVVLVGRTAREAHPSGRGQREAVADRLSLAGGEVLIRHGDVADGPRVREILREVQHRFGAIHGVLHLAGVPGGGIVQRLGPDEVAAALQAKVEGTHTLAEAVRDVGGTPDFLALFSSLAALTGVPGQACYAAGNAFLDAFAPHASRDLGIPTLSINWDRWLGTGMAADADDQRREPNGVNVTGGYVTGGMDPVRAVAAFTACLAALPLGQVAVSTRHPDELPRALAAQATRWHSMPNERPADQPDLPAVARSTLDSDYVAPRTSLEQAVTAIWSKVLGVEGIGLHDDFFDLGGHSLMALEIAELCESQLGLAVDMQDLFAAPTIARLVAAVDGESPVFTDSTTAPPAHVVHMGNDNESTQGKGRDGHDAVDQAGGEVRPALRDVRHQ